MATESQWPEFTSLDADGDGSISKDEAKANADLTAMWAEHDSDKNGSLSNWNMPSRARCTRGNTRSSRRWCPAGKSHGALRLFPAGVC